MKAIGAALVMICLAGPAAFGQHLQSGTFLAGVDSEGWSLNEGAGARVHLVFVRFSEPFSETPSILVGLTSYDGAPAPDGTLRVRVKPESINRDGFVIKVSTWGECRVAGVEGNWIAAGR